MALHASLRRRENPGYWAAPMTSDLVRMALRHIRITFQRRTGSQASPQ
jgi:hypothetical protein